MFITPDAIDFIIKLNNISTEINRYVPIFLFFFGITGNLLSCLIFLQPALRSNPCTVCFLAASLSNLVFLTTLLSPMLDAWNKAFNLMSTISAICKLSMFIILIARTLALWFIVLATIDRYLASSLEINRRRMRNLKQTYRWIIITCIVAVLIWTETVYCFDANSIGTPIQCYTKSENCRLYNDITLALITITIPSIMMLIFGFLTIANIGQSKRMIHPTNTNVIVSDRRHRRTEHNLTRMLLTQVFLVVILNLPLALHIIYLTITFYQPKTPVQGTVDGLVFNTLLLFPFISSSISFFLYTLSGSVFRQTLVQLGKRMIRCLQCNP
jgi:hypothetical protein